MQKDSKFFDDIAKMASGAAGGLLDMTREMESIIATKVEAMMQRMNFVTKEEFDTVQGMLAKSREEQEALKKRISDLEQRFK